MKDFTGKKVLILGLGLNQGGVGAAKFFAQSGAQVRVTDLKDETNLKPSLEQLKEFKNIDYVLGEHRERDLSWADFIIRNWAVKPDNKYLEYGRKLGKPIETDMGIFLQFVSPKQIIGITGSKGKTTTASLIYQALKMDPRGGDGRVVLAGNIGKSVLDAVWIIKPDTQVILELSSFQLEAFEQHQISPHIALITNIFPEHLNYYQYFERYIDSKRVIAQYQTDADNLYLNARDPLLNSPDFLKDLKAGIKFFSKDDLPQNFTPQLPGEHNRLSYAAALIVAKQFGIDEQTALSSMNKFQGAEFRLQIIKETDGVKIINDSSSTNPNATIEALKTYPNCILICGGMNKGLDYKDLAKAIETYPKKVYFLEGDATEEIAKQLSVFSLQSLDKTKGVFNNLERLLKQVKEGAKNGDVILFSPGATSFNLFQNEFDRGRKFNQAVEEIF